MQERKCTYCNRPYIPSRDKTCHGCGAPVVSLEIIHHYARGPQFQTMATTSRYSYFSPHMISASTRLW